MDIWLSKVGLSTEMLVKFIIVCIGIVAVVLVAKIIAGIVGALIRKATFLKKMFKKVDVKLDMDLIATIVSKVLYFVLIIGAVIGGGAFLGFLPQDALSAFTSNYLFTFLNAAGLAVIAWFLAVLARSAILKLLETTDIDEKLGAKTGTNVSLSSSLSSVGFWGVILFFIPQILSKLGQDELLAPITGIITDITAFLPVIAGAMIIIAISYFIGKIIAKIVTELLSSFGFDKVLELVGIKNTQSKMTPSSVIGNLTFIYILLFGALEAANKIGFTSLKDIISEFMAFGTNVLIGIIIFGIGMYLANLTSSAVKSATSSTLLPKIAKAAILILTTFMGLEQMGLGGDIITQAFPILLGSVAVAFALAVGLGSKEVAGEEVKRFIENMRK